MNKIALTLAAVLLLPCSADAQGLGRFATTPTVGPEFLGGSGTVTLSGAPTDPAYADAQWIASCPPMTRGQVADLLERATARMDAINLPDDTDTQIINKVAECLRPWPGGAQ